MAGSGDGVRGATLALDVDGVLLDPDRGGQGRWHVALEQRFGVPAGDLQAVFFRRTWADVVCGRQPIERALGDALAELGWSVTTDELLACWFEADFVVRERVVRAARSWAAGGARLVLVTDQEHRRAAFLRERIATLLPISGMAYSAEVGCQKRDDGFFARAAALLSIEDATRVVFVDDSLPNIEAARRHGWTAVHFAPGVDWEHEVTTALA
jgi:putative hydrolase of the HAD superfamily